MNRTRRVLELIAMLPLSSLIATLSNPAYRTYRERQWHKSIRDWDEGLESSSNERISLRALVKSMIETSTVFMRSMITRQVMGNSRMALR